jgi:hypothetical protein
MSDKPTRRDYLLFVLLTGLRRTNAMEVEWKHVDLERRKLHVPVTKSGEPFDVPLSTALIDLLAARRKTDPIGRWVFPAASASGHIEEPREDVTGGYMSLGLERLRGPMQRITDYILSICATGPGKVMPLDCERKRRAIA